LARLPRDTCFNRSSIALNRRIGNNPASDVRNADALSVNPGPRPGL
jgi:hypothetical protein